jgi:hypothetical protein
MVAAIMIDRENIGIADLDHENTRISQPRD